MSSPSMFWYTNGDAEMYAIITANPKANTIV